MAVRASLRSADGSIARFLEATEAALAICAGEESVSDIFLILAAIRQFVVKQK